MFAYTRKMYIIKNDADIGYAPSNNILGNNIPTWRIVFNEFVDACDDNIFIRQ